MENKQFRNGYRDAATMNILRIRFIKAFPTADFTYGNITSADRKRLQLPKSHANDAVAVAVGNVERITDINKTVYFMQLRKKKRSLHESVPRKGRKIPNRFATRNSKNTKSVDNFHLNDKVRLDNRIYRKICICKR